MTWNAGLRLVHQFLWLAPLLALMVFFTGVGRRRSARSLDDGQVEFPPSSIQFGAWAVMTIFCTQGAAEAFQHNHGEFLNFVTGAGLALMAVLFLSLFPGTIIVGDDGIRQIYWFSRNKCIPWKEIVEINTGEKERIITITGANRTKIIHSSQLPDRARFLAELKRHCGEDLPPDFPREPHPSKN